jgi:hypothetical protein
MLNHLTDLPRLGTENHGFGKRLFRLHVAGVEGQRMRRLATSIVGAMGAVLILFTGAMATVDATDSSEDQGDEVTRRYAPLDTVTPTPTPSCNLAWRVVTSPDVGNLHGVSALSGSDVWAVGNGVLHWDGSGWITTTSTIGALSAVDEFTATDVWIVGNGIMHWDGATWTTATSPIGALNGVDAYAANDVWAVGNGIIHWDGTSWSISPNPGGGPLYGVTAIGGGDVWAVGNTSATPSQTLTMHRTGGVWNVVPSPSTGTRPNHLTSVTSVPGGQVTAVGDYEDMTSHTRTQVLTWTGSAWSISYPPTVGPENNYLYSISATSSTDIWSVGTWYDLIGHEYFQTLIMRNWLVQQSPNLGPTWDMLYGVAAVAPDDVWAVGFYNGSGPNGQSLVENYSTGCPAATSTPLPTRTQTVATSTATYTQPSPTPTQGSFGCYYNFYERSTTCTPPSSYSYRFQFGLHTCPSGGSGMIYLQVADNPSGPWANYDQQPYSCSCQPSSNNLVEGTFIEAYIPPAYQWYRARMYGTVGGLSVDEVTPATVICGTQVTATPTHTSIPIITNTVAPTWSSTPITFTSTPTLGTATPTACTITFSDVPSDSTFYPFIRCLACRSILGGYNDGTFSPGNDVTRGQLSKIVSNAAGFNDTIPDSQHTFTDVPSTNPFWVWIERMVLHNVISGYPCGGPLEPCDNQNRPYFRWGANATRGQISKIVSEAKGFDDEVPPTQQTFTDVPHTNPFWVWVERLAERGIMSGYQCGGSVEPCDPFNRPYFRWYNNATRGQTSKIVANTFFPNCQTPSGR